MSQNYECIAAMERELRAARETADYSAARICLRTYLWRFCAEGTASGSILEAVEEIALSGRPLPEVASVLLRALSVEGFLPSGPSGGNSDRCLVNIVQVGLPKLLHFLGVTQKGQTYEKLPQLRDAHRQITALLNPLKSEFASLEGLVSARQPIMGMLNHSAVREYTYIFGLEFVRRSVDEIAGAAPQILRGQASLSADLERCEGAIASARAEAKERTSFLVDDYLIPFLDQADASVARFIQASRSRFRTKIVAPLRDGEPLAKRYPLHEVGRQLRIRLPLENDGPGSAISVRAELTVRPKGISLQSSTVFLGDVLPGPFSITCDAVIDEPTDSFLVEVDIEWRQVGRKEEFRELFEFRVTAQPADVDWSEYEHWHPYSTDAAEGERFIGRGEMLRELTGRLLRDPMEPFYITGQKRVGKTSLVKAAAAFAQERAIGKEICSAYILWGEIAHADATASLSELGRSIEEAITAQLPPEVTRPVCDFNGSLSPLIKLAALAAKVTPDKRFVVIIDEFDEIHQELYLYGNLAETFFANLRALAASRNVCLVLVGGENMPFIMERQGEKLNKFTRKNLSYFSRSTEWDDFQELVQRPSRPIVQWHEGAMSAVFNETNGNPYFTNLVCSRVIGEVVRHHDADVTLDEIQEALEAEIPSLDANSFAHLWRDGIFKPLSEREPDIIRRRRVLVALARCSRKGLPLTLPRLAENKGSSNLSEGEIGPTLNEFKRRGVLSEEDGTFAFDLPIFERWLSQNGMSVVQPDPVSEELAALVQASEDAAFVRSPEVVSLVKQWHPYQGRQVSTDELRGWYGQVDGFIEQRLLFKIAQRVRSVSEIELRTKCRYAYSQLRTQIKDFARRSLSDRRGDVIVTYLDGNGKSGSFYAGLFAEENNISTKRICSPSDLSSELRRLAKASETVSAIIVVDDIAATGKTLIDGISRLQEECGVAISGAGAKLLACALYAVPEGVDAILKHLHQLPNIEGDFRAGEVLGPGAAIFHTTADTWSSVDECLRAKALAMDLGARISRSNPLGYGGGALGIVFPTTVPNNSLPILHARARAAGIGGWEPLFLRPGN